jgi:hypothetical protein
MTFEHKLLVSLGEIKAIVFECTRPSGLGAGEQECKSRIVVSPDDIGSLPSACPRSHAWNWNVPTENAGFINALPQFIDALKKLRQAGREQQAGFRVFLEFDETESAE